MARVQFALLGKRRFLPLFIAQFLGAFNDNFFKTAIVMLHHLLGGRGQKPSMA